MKQTFCFFLTSFLLFSCTNFHLVNSSITDEVILEVISTTSEMVYPKGDILIMRLHQSGRFEYDDYPNYNPPETRNASTIRKEGKLEIEDVAELVKIANQPDFLSAKEYYPELHQNSRIDAFVKTKIRFSYQGKEKIIEAENFWDILSFPEDRIMYPKPMVGLLEKTRELKAKALGKTFDKFL